MKVAQVIIALTIVGSALGQDSGTSESAITASSLMPFFGIIMPIDKSGCYDLGDETPFACLFAPFYASFHNVPVAILAEYFGYYPGMGMGLQTLSVHRKGTQLLASGSFQKGLSGAWKARFYMTGDDFQHWFDEYHKAGLRPREIGVTLDGSSNPRYNVIWQKRGNEGYYCYPSLTQAEWDKKWKDHVVTGKMRVVDHFIFPYKGSARHAVIFAGDSSGFTDIHGLNASKFKTEFDKLYKSGMRLESVCAEESGSGLKFGGVFRKRSGSWIAHTLMSPTDYQEKYDEYSKSGYKVHKIQGYANSGKFAVIWYRP